MIVELAKVEDAKEILNLQKLAYESEAEIYNDLTIPPLTQTLEEIITDFENQVFLKASVEEKIISSVRAYMKQETCLIGRLIVHPNFQGQGIGPICQESNSQQEFKPCVYGKTSQGNLNMVFGADFEPDTGSSGSKWINCHCPSARRSSSSYMLKL